VKAISIRQPWAWAIFHGKPVENRNWWSAYRGPLLIHAAKKDDIDGAWWIFENRETLGLPMITVEHLMNHTKGAFVGIVKMVACVKNYDSPWFFGPYGHVYRNAREFKAVIPFRGELGIFNVPDGMSELDEARDIINP
jgi:hypothetical protein